MRDSLVVINYNDGSEPTFDPTFTTYYGALEYARIASELATVASVDLYCGFMQITFIDGMRRNKRPEGTKYVVAVECFNGKSSATYAYEFDNHMIATVYANYVADQDCVYHSDLYKVGVDRQLVHVVRYVGEDESDD